MLLTTLWDACLVSCGHAPLVAVQAVMKLLRRHNASRGYVETILHARVPIIKFLDGPTGEGKGARQALACEW
jgi:DNA polymerase sigma